LLPVLQWSGELQASWCALVLTLNRKHQDGLGDLSLIP